jgi:hypothetical protein
MSFLSFSPRGASDRSNGRAVTALRRRRPSRYTLKIVRDSTRQDRPLSTRRDPQRRDHPNASREIARVMRHDEITST